MEFEKKFIKRFEELCNFQHPQTLFRDWAEAAAIAISNTTTARFKDELWEKREKEYLAIAAKYGPEVMKGFAQQLGELALMMEDHIEDYLGKAYMILGGNSRTGQFFTPWHLCRMMAATTNAGAEPALINEPACGAGGNILAVADVLKEKGINYQQTMNVVCQDLDYLCVWMCYIQLSLIGVRAKVIQGNTLAREVNDVWLTPACYFPGGGPV